MFVAAGAATFMVFAVALQNFFVQPPILTRSQRLFQDLSVVVGVTHVVALLGVQTVSHTWAGIGIGMYVVALTLFLGAIEAARRSPITRTFVYEPRCDCILTAGPYRLIRHPIYLSYSLAWLAAPVAMQSAVLLLTAIFMITCYVISAREEERRLVNRPAGRRVPETPRLVVAPHPVRLLMIGTSWPGAPARDARGRVGSDSLQPASRPRYFAPPVDIRQETEHAPVEWRHDLTCSRARWTS